MGEKKQEGRTEIVDGSGNVFADLGLEDAEDLLLLSEIEDWIEEVEHRLEEVLRGKVELTSGDEEFTDACARLRSVLNRSPRSTRITEESYARRKDLKEDLLVRLDRIETLLGIQRGLESMRAGRGRPVDEAFASLREELGIGGTGRQSLLEDFGDDGDES